MRDQIIQRFVVIVTRQQVGRSANERASEPTRTSLDCARDVLSTSSKDGASRRSGSRESVSGSPRREALE